MSAHVLEQLGLYLDDELVPSDRASVETHLRECAECSKRLEEFAAVDELARALPADAPDGYFTDFAARVRGRVQVKSAARAPFRLPVWVLAAAAAVALGVTVPALLRRQSLEPLPAPVVLREAAPQQRPAPVDADATEAATPAASTPSTRLEETKSQPARSPQAPPPGPRANAGPPQKEYAEPHGLAGGVAGSVESRAALADASRDEETDALKKRDQVDEPRILGQLSAERQTKTEASGYAQPPAAASVAPAEANERRRTAADAAAPKLALEGARKDKAAGAASVRGRFGELLDRTATNAGEARALREAWRVHASLAQGGEADEARVRVVEAGAQAYRLSHDLADLTQLEKDADAYLARPDALQVSRVRAVLLGVRSDRP